MTSAELAAALARPENADLAALVRYIIDQGKLIARLREENAALEARSYALAVAIMGGEDAPGYADSVETDVLVEQHRANCRMYRDAEERAIRERDAAVERARTARADALTEAAVLCGKWATECYQKGAARWDNRAAAYENAEANLLALRAVEQGGADDGR